MQLLSSEVMEYNGSKMHAIYSILCIENIEGIPSVVKEWKTVEAEKKKQVLDIITKRKSKNV